MSIASEITRINNNIASAYTAIRNAGGTVPASANSANLATAIASIPSGVVYDENYTIVGSPTISSNYVASGFGTSSYIIPSQVFNPGNNSWELNAKITTGNSVTLNWIFQSCVGSGQNNRYGFSCYLNEGKFVLAVSSGTSSWLFDAQGTYSVQTNTTYWLKCGWDGEKYYLEYSTDGTTFIRDVEYSSTTPMTSLIVSSFVGVFSAIGYQFPFSGSIYLKELYTKINGVETWRAVTAQQ